MKTLADALVVLDFKQGTIKLTRKARVQEKFEAEVLRLLNSGAIDPNDHNRGLLFGAAIENIADNWLRGNRKNSDYRNLKRF